MALLLCLRQQLQIPEGVLWFGFTIHCLKEVMLLPILGQINFKNYSFLFAQSFDRHTIEWCGSGGIIPKLLTLSLTGCE
jgi:hypothetical protein